MNFNFKQKIKKSVASFKSKVRAKHKKRLKDISEMQKVIIAIEEIRLATGLEVTEFTKNLELAGCKIKLSSNKGQAYRNMLKFDRVCFSLDKVQKLYDYACKVQKYHNGNKK